VGLRPGPQPARHHTVQPGPGLTCPLHACVMASQPYQLCSTGRTQAGHRQSGTMC
jgi:hypothetical protein